MRSLVPREFIGRTRKAASTIRQTTITPIQTAVRPLGLESTGGAVTPAGPSSTPGAESAAFVRVSRGFFIGRGSLKLFAASTGQPAPGSGDQRACRAATENTRRGLAKRIA